MIKCPKCNKKSEDGSKFCEHCGSSLYEIIFCTNCGVQTSTEAAFCKNCGASLTLDEPKVKKHRPRKDKQSLKKAFLLGGIGAASIVLVIAVSILVSTLLGGDGRIIDSNYALYVKEQELMLRDLSKDQSLQVTSRLIDNSSSNIDVSNRDLVEAAYSMNNYCTLSKNGKILVFPDRIDPYEGFSLYYRDLTKPDEQAVKIDSDITSYQINDAGTLITFIKERYSDGALYQYDLNNNNKTKIDSDVKTYDVSSDGSKIWYLNGEGNIYLKTSDEYKVKLCSDVAVLLKVYDTGEIYYLRSNPTILMSYFDDYMKRSDASMTKPQKPSAPSYFASDDAWEAYERAYAQYEQAYDSYQEKLKRDERRLELENEMVSISYTLCYFDGDMETVVTDTYIADTDFNSYGSPYVPYLDSQTTASGIPMITYKAFDQSSVSKLELSEIGSDYTVYGVKSMVKDSLLSISELYVSAGKNVSIVAQGNVSSYVMDSKGKTIFFTDSDDNLYKINIINGSAQNLELYDTDVVYVIGFIAEDQFGYYKGTNSVDLEFYINQKLIDYDVSGIIYDSKLGRLIYSTDWDYDKMCSTLKIYEDGETAILADDVNSYTVLPNGSILYLYDYSTNYYKGDLYLYKNGISEKIDEDVTCIVTYNDSRYRGTRFHYAS